MIVVILPDESIPPIIRTMKAKGYHAVLVYTNEALALIRTIVQTHSPSDDLPFGTVGVNDGNTIWTLMPTKAISREQLALHLGIPADRLDGRGMALVLDDHFPYLRERIPGAEIIEPLVGGTA